MHILIHVLSTDQAFPKSESSTYPGSLIDRYVGGPNILLLTGPDWKRHRKARTTITQMKQF